MPRPLNTLKGLQEALESLLYTAHVNLKKGEASHDNEYMRVALREFTSKMIERMETYQANKVDPLGDRKVLDRLLKSKEGRTVLIAALSAYMVGEKHDDDTVSSE